MPLPRQLMPVHEVATRLNVSNETVKRMLRAGRLPGCKVGGDWRVEPAELDRVIALSHNGYRTPKPVGRVTPP